MTIATFILCVALVVCVVAAIGTCLWVDAGRADALSMKLVAEVQRDSWRAEAMKSRAALAAIRDNIGHERADRIVREREVTA